MAVVTIDKLRDDTGYSEHGICDARCRQCKHCGTESTVSKPFCVYIMDTGHRRPCPAGKHCTKFVQKGVYVKKHFQIAKKVNKKCVGCGDVYQMGEKQKYCPECFKRREHERVMANAKAKRDKKAEIALKKVRICKLCGAEYKSASDRVAYCDDCRKIPMTTRRRMMDLKKKEA